MDWGKIAQGYADFARQYGKAYLWKTMRLWESQPADDPHYSLYQMALKTLYKTPEGQEYVRLFRGSNNANNGL